MHNNIMAAGSRDRLPILAMGRYAHQPTTGEYLEVPERIVVETFSNISPKNKTHYDAEKEAIHLLLTRIGDEIYLTIDACKIAHNMWIVIERLQQGESLNKQDVKTKVATMQVNVQFLQKLQPEWSRFVTIIKQTIDLDKKSYHKLFDILKYSIVTRYLLLTTKTSSYAPPAKTLPLTISHATTRHKGKEIAKPITTLSELASEEDNDSEQAQRNKEM
ncbi:hypothetical protein Tco_1271399 [Tanacetum coccineum]